MLQKKWQEFQTQMQMNQATLYYHSLIAIFKTSQLSSQLYVMYRFPAVHGQLLHLEDWQSQLLSSHFRYSGVSQKLNATETPLQSTEWWYL